MRNASRVFSFRASRPSRRDACAPGATISLVLLLVSLTLSPTSLISVVAQPAAHSTNGGVDSRALGAEITDFLAAEVSAHLNAIKSLDPPPEKVLGAGASGEYTWGTFMRAVGAYAELSGKRTLAGRDLASEVGRIGLLEHRLRSTRFSQLYAVLALRHFGRDLNSNPVWQSLNQDEREQWRKLLDVSAFYDARKRQVINLPENYLGVAARIASVSYQLGLLKDRELLDGVVARAAEPFRGGSLYADDAPPTGRFDRYSNEYARFVWDAAQAAERNDVLEALRPTLKAQMRLWWDLVQPDGYGYAWGRSLGAISYMDTLEIVSFLARHPEFRPAPLAELASAFYQAWRWLNRDYRRDAHLLSVFAYGRGNYGYITREREWQQTTGFLGKLAISLAPFLDALKRENVAQFPSDISRRDLARFESFRRGDRQFGVWLVRQGPVSFTLPITTGTRPGVADYLPAPHGLAGLAAPVEQAYPALASFIELKDGRTLTTTDGADEIEVENGGLGLRAKWRRWALVGGRAGQLVDPQITSEVAWSLKGTTLVREEVLVSTEPSVLKSWKFAVPSTADRHRLRLEQGRRHDVLESQTGTLDVTASAGWPMTTTIMASGNGALGRGARGALPIHLVFEARDVQLAAGTRARWLIAIKAEGERQ